MGGSSQASTMEFSDSLSLFFLSSSLSLSSPVCDAICLYYPSLRVGFLDCVQCPNRADLSKSLLISHQMSRSSSENLAYAFVLTSPEVSTVSYSSYELPAIKTNLWCDSYKILRPEFKSWTW